MNRKATSTVITLSAPLGKMDDLFWVELLREGTWHYDNPSLPGGKFSVTKKDLKEFKKNYDAGVKGYLLPVNNEHTAVNMKEAEGWSDGKPLPQNVVGWLRGVKEGKSLTGSDAIFGLLSFEDPEIKKLADSGQVKFVSCELNLSWANPEDGNKPYKVIEGVAITARPYIKRMAPMKKVSRVGKPALAVNLSEVDCEADEGILISLTDHDEPGQGITPEFLKQFGGGSDHLSKPTFTGKDGRVYPYEVTREKNHGPYSTEDSFWHGVSVFDPDDNTKRIGGITASVHGNKAYTHSHGLLGEHRGNGIGSQAMEALLGSLGEHGVKSLVSDSFVSGPAQNVYRAMSDRGYRVRPYNDEGGHIIRLSDDGDGAGYQYDTWHLGTTGRRQHNWKTFATDSSGNHVGHFSFSTIDDELYPNMIHVEDDHRRKGIATAMYLHGLEKSESKKLMPAMTTEDGGRFRSSFDAKYPQYAHSLTESDLELSGDDFSATGPKTDKIMAWHSDSHPITKNEPGEGAWIGQPDNHPKLVYHGSVKNFNGNVFTNVHHNPESYYGSGHYFSDSIDDVNANYANPQGPDIQSKVDQTADRMRDNLDEEDPNRDYDDEAKSQALEKEVHHEGTVTPAYLHMRNPIIIGGPHETKFEQNWGDPEDDDAEASGSFFDFVDAVRDTASRWGMDHDSIAGHLHDNFSGEEEVGAQELVDALRNHNAWSMAEDDYGNLTHDHWRELFEELGHDGIVMNADNAFGSGRKYGQAMKGVYPDTNHYIVWNSNQIKSPMARVFDPNSPDITMSETDGTGSIELGDTVYRGEGYAFDKFDPEKISDEHAFGKAIYATTSKEIADMYADGPAPNVKFFGVPDNFKVFDVNAPAPDSKALVYQALQDAIENPKTYKVMGHMSGGYIAPDHNRIMENAQDFLSLQPDGLPAHKYLDSLSKVTAGGSGKPYYASIVAHNHLGRVLSGSGYDAAKYKDFLDNGAHSNYAIFNINGLNDSLGSRQISTSEPNEDSGQKVYLMSSGMGHYPRPMGGTTIDFKRKLKLAEGSSTYYKAKEIMNGMVRDPGVAQTLADAAVALGLPGDLSFQIMMDWENDHSVLNAALLAMLGFGLLQGGFVGTVDDAAGMILQRANYDAAILAEGVILPAKNKLYEADTDGKLKFAEREGMVPVTPLYARHVDEKNQSHFLGNPLLSSIGVQPVSSHSRVKYHSGSDKTNVSMVQYPHPDFEGATGIVTSDSDGPFKGYAFTTPQFYEAHGDEIAANSGVTATGVDNIIKAAKRALAVAKHHAKHGVHDTLQQALHYRGFVDGDWNNMKPDSDAALYAVMGHTKFRPVLYANMGREPFEKMVRGHFSAENLVSAHRAGMLPKGSVDEVKSSAEINRNFLSMSPTAQAEAHYDKKITGLQKAINASTAAEKGAFGLEDKLRHKSNTNDLRKQLSAARLAKFDEVDSMAEKIASEQRFMSSAVNPDSFEDAEQDRAARYISDTLKTHDWSTETGDRSGQGNALVTASLAVSPGVLARQGITRKDLLTKAFGEGYQTEAEADLNRDVPDQFQWNGSSLSRVVPLYDNNWEEGKGIDPSYDKATKSLFRSFHVRGAEHSGVENVQSNKRMRHLISTIATIDASLSHLFKKVAVVVDAAKPDPDWMRRYKGEEGARKGGFYDPMGHAIHIGPNYMQTVPHEVFHALDNCLAREVFGSILDPASIGIEFLSHAHDALNDPVIMARLKTKTNPERLEWAKAFAGFVNGLSNNATFRPDVDATLRTPAYSVSPHEIFARFGAAFHSWATGGMDAVKQTNSWGDDFPEHRFKRFVKLLQWRSLIDSKNKVVEPPEPVSAEDQEPHLSKVGG